ncbi:hypothetical protein ACN6A1_14645 [Myxococcus virescens]|uniref:hypothetical protein n=1 Tax=Myxococcus virescens TaxID=83456 RepID=UPI003DA2C24B
MEKQRVGPGLLSLLAVASLGCASSTTGAANRRDAYALASCTDTVSCCMQRNPGVPEACGLTAGEAAAHLATMDAAVRFANEKTRERADDSADEAWKEQCRANYVLCRDEKNPVWEGDCYACFRYCEGQHEWPDDQCRPRRKKRG